MIIGTKRLEYPGAPCRLARQARGLLASPAETPQVPGTAAGPTGIQCRGVAADADAAKAPASEQLVEDLGGQFHRDYGVILRAVLFAVDSHAAKITAGLSAAGAVR